jgi:hypothetical protein
VWGSGQRATSQVLAHQDPLVDGEAGLLGEDRRRPHADAQDDEVCFDPRPPAEDRGVAVHASHGLAEVEDHPLGLVEAADEPADVHAEDALQGLGFRGHDVHGEAPLAQRGGDLETDEARADHQRALGGRRSGDDRAAVGEGAQVVDPRIVRTGYLEAHGIGAGGNQERSELEGTTVSQKDALPRHVERLDRGIHEELDPFFRVVLGRPQGNPGLFRRPRQVVLRKIRPVARRRIVGADERDRPLVALAPEHVRRGQTGGSTSDDDDGGRDARTDRRLRCG